MITNDTLWIIFVVALGLPSAIVGLLVRRIEKKLEKVSKEREEKETTRLRYEEMMIELSMASLTLAQATAEAVEKIPDAQCSVEMHSALKWGQEIKNKYHKFAREQAARAVNG